MPIQNFDNIWKPGPYHGKHKMKRYFEGWYFKLISREERTAIAIIPGVSFDIEGSVSHAFIQLIDGNVNASHYIKYDIDEFLYNPKNFEITIGKNYFSTNRIELNIVDKVVTLKGTLIFHSVKPWPVTLLSPGVMGWYSFVPFMECYHGVLSFDHLIEGRMDINGETTDFTGGRGYIEKDWGRSFPRYHIWLQTNHFDFIGTSLMVSIANIPWFGSYFDGFIAGLLYNDHLYRFTTYTGARLTNLDYDEKQLNIQVSSKRYKLRIGITPTAGIELLSPKLGSMNGRISESLRSRVSVRLYEMNKDMERLLFQDTGRHAGFEIVGKPEDIASIHLG